ncbi:MAG: class I SAM-dependent methyltransferase [Acidimicrobiales bacterium]|nr:class I SAM-dependent methyltransferase [Acidimicrobiales bacterium]
MGLYDSIGTTYSAVRVEDPRIAAQIHDGLGPGHRILNVGAGTGSYEPLDRTVVAVEPSPVMIAQRPAGSAPVLQATAEALPLRSATFDVAMAVLTVHHWSDRRAGLAELARVARQVILYFEPLVATRYWLLDYFPEVADSAIELEAPGRAEIAEVLTVGEVRRVLVPPDCTDGFAAAYWARPEAYLDRTVQAGMSAMATMDDRLRRAGIERLRADLVSGGWDERYGHLRTAPSFDGGYRLAICHS